MTVKKITGHERSPFLMNILAIPSKTVKLRDHFLSVYPVSTWVLSGTFEIFIRFVSGSSLICKFNTPKQLMLVIRIIVKIVRVFLHMFN